MVNTAKVTDRRQLRFNSLSELRADLAKLEEADRAGGIRCTGNWTSGQILSHLASFVSYAYDGYPPELSNPPFFIRWILKLRRNAFIRNALPVGVKIPGIASGTVGMRDVSCTEGLILFRRELERLEKSAPAKPNPIFGPMTHEEWMNLHQRHAELHLSFMHPGEKTGLGGVRARKA